MYDKKDKNSNSNRLQRFHCTPILIYQPMILHYMSFCLKAMSSLKAFGTKRA
jgi:hypothetical protein